MPSRTRLNEDTPVPYFGNITPVPANGSCPTCDAEIEPDEHEVIQGAKSAKSVLSMIAFANR